VAALSVRLFDSLAKLHGLGPAHRLLLQVASLLHEVGSFVSTRAHHKRSYYLIVNSEVFGLSKEERQVVANVARYHRRSPPKPTHTGYMALPRDRRVVVNKLAALVRVADALDIGHAQQISDFAIRERRPAELVITVHSDEDLSLEERSVEGKADVFEEVFGLRVRLEQAARPRARLHEAEAQPGTVPGAASERLAVPASVGIPIPALSVVRAQEGHGPKGTAPA